MSKMGVDLIYEDIENETKVNCGDSEKKLNEFLKSLSDNDKKKLKEKLGLETEEREDPEEDKEPEENEESGE